MYCILQHNPFKCDEFYQWPGLLEEILGGKEKLDRSDFYLARVNFLWRQAETNAVIDAQTLRGDFELLPRVCKSCMKNLTLLKQIFDFSGRTIM